MAWAYPQAPGYQTHGAFPPQSAPRPAQPQLLALPAPGQQQAGLPAVPPPGGYLATLGPLSGSYLSQAVGYQTLFRDANPGNENSIINHFQWEPVCYLQC